MHRLGVKLKLNKLQYSLKANISQTVHPIHSSISGSRQWFPGSVDRMVLFCGLIISKMTADGRLGMMALSRVTQLGFLVLKCHINPCPGNGGLDIPPGVVFAKNRQVSNGINIL